MRFSRRRKVVSRDHQPKDVSKAKGRGSVALKVCNERLSVTRASARFNGVQGDFERCQIESARNYAAERGCLLDESIAVDRGKSVWAAKNVSEGVSANSSSVSNQRRFAGTRS
jgi:hypothetical protein